MKNITYEQFCEKLKEFNTFNSDDLTSLYNEYGEEKVNDFFEYSHKALSCFLGVTYIRL